MRDKRLSLSGGICAVIILFCATAWAGGALDYQNAKEASANKDYKSAAQLYTSAIVSGELSDKPLIDAYYSRGLAWFELGDLNKALSDFNMTIQLNPRHSDAYYSRAFVWDYKGQRDKAIEDFTKALEINPYDADSYYSRGNCWFDQNMLDKAIADYSQAIKLRPKFPDVYYNRAVAYYNKSDVQAALKDAKQALSLAPQNKTYQDLVKELEAKAKELQ